MKNENSLSLWPPQRYQAWWKYLGTRTTIISNSWKNREREKGENGSPFIGPPFGGYSPIYSERHFYGARLNKLLVQFVAIVLHKEFQGVQFSGYYQCDKWTKSVNCVGPDYPVNSFTRGNPFPTFVVKDSKLARVERGPLILLMEALAGGWFISPYATTHSTLKVCLTRLVTIWKHGEN